MQLPIDLAELFNEATDIEAARDTPLSVSVYIDDSAPADLIAHVRNGFASSLPSVRMTVSYLDAQFSPHEGDDIAVIVAGVSRKIGASAAVIRAVDVPVMVATTSPAALAEMAKAAGYEIPDGDMVAPFPAGEGEEPGVIDDEAAAALDERMGRWIVSVGHEKRLAFAIAFPFMRRALARDAVQATSLQNAVVGLIPFLPGADLPIMTLNQAKMVLQISAAYGHEFGKERFKELAAVVSAAYLSRTLARELIEFIPVLGFAVRTGVAYSATSALGYAIIAYYEGGEDVTGVANVVERAMEFGSKTVQTVQQKIPKLIGMVENAPEEAPRALNKAIEYAQGKAPVVIEAVDNARSKIPVLVEALNPAK